MYTPASCKISAPQGHALQKKSIPGRAIRLFLLLAGSIGFAAFYGILPARAQYIQRECTLASPDKYTTVFNQSPFVLARWCPKDEATIGALKSPLERAVCDDKGLSNLDERLNRAYERALKISEEPEALQTEQRRWLRQRDRCVTNGKLDINRLWRHYEVRLYELTKLLPLPDCVTAEQKANLARQICPEAEFMPNEHYKATCLKKQLNQKKITPNENPGKLASYCPAMLQALITDSPAIEYVEPVVRTSEALHPGLIRYRACYDAYVAHGDGFKGNQYYIHDFKAHGFRLYRLDLDGNPKNGLEEYLYLEEMSISELVGHGDEDALPIITSHIYSGYPLLTMPPQGQPTSLAQCRYEGVLHTSPQRREREFLGMSVINALLKFRSQYYDYYLSDNQINISPLVRKNRKPDQGSGCSWSYQ